MLGDREPLLCATTAPIGGSGVSHNSRRRRIHFELPHSTFTEAALNLIIRSSEGTLRAVKNLCISSMIEAVREGTRTIDTKQVNAVLLQPHWRHNQQHEPAEPIMINASRTGVQQPD